jgi:hypothetical protein
MSARFSYSTGANMLEPDCKHEACERHFVPRPWVAR